MIPRYSRPEMVAIWEPDTKFRIWFEIEAHACEALAEIGVIPKEAARNIRERGDKAVFDVAKIDEIEREVKHDVIAFLTHLAEFIGDDARFVHQGMTSSDVLDTCLNVQLARASDILLRDMDDLLAAIKRRAFEHKDTVCIGRSHGIHAEPVTFGLKMAEAYAEFKRCRERLVNARKEIATCAISGAVGTFANIDPRVEEHVAKALGLEVEPVSTQVIPRDRHAMFFATLGVIASSIERVATEIRHLQRTEVLEAEEYFSEGQKGSSAMPHKRNPVLTENLTGLDDKVIASLVQKSVLKVENHRILWVFQQRRYPVINNTEITEIKARLRKIIETGELPDPRDAVLISLVHACHLFSEIFSEEELEKHLPQITKLAKFDFVGQALAESISDIEQTICLMNEALYQYT